MLKYVWTKFEILTPYISWDTVHFVEILTIYPKSASALLWLLYGEKPILRNFSKGVLWCFYDIWVWQSGFNSWNQNFRKCTLFVWSTVRAWRFSPRVIINCWHAFRYSERSPSIYDCGFSAYLAGSAAMPECKLSITIVQAWQGIVEIFFRFASIVSFKICYAVKYHHWTPSHMIIPPP